MAIPTANRICHFDLSNPACFSGSGLTINDLTIANNDYTFTNTNYTFTTTTGGEVLIDNTNLLSRAALNSYSYGTNPISIVMWMQLNVAGGADLSMFQAVNDTGGAGGWNTLYWGTKTGSRNLFISSSGGEFNTSESINLNEWYMLAVTFPSGGNSGNIKLYKNGVVVSGTYTGVSTVTLPGGTPTFIDGVVANLGVWSCDMTVGLFSLYNAELTPTQIQDYYDATQSRFVPLVETFKVDAADPASYSGTGNTVYDLSAAARVGNLDSQNASPTWSPSFGGIFTLDGSNDIFEFPGGGVAVSQPGSISVWFRSDDVFNTGNVVSQGSYGSNGWGLNLGQAYSTNPNILSFVSHANGYRSSGIAVTVGEWQFVTLNYNVDGTSDLYINGSIGTTGMASIGINPPSQLIRIGYDGGGVNSPKIDVAQVYMYGQAINLEQHTDLFDATKSPFVPPAPIATQNSNVGGRSFNKGLNG